MSRKKLLKLEFSGKFSPRTVGDRINLAVAKSGLNGSKFSKYVGISTGNLNSLINDDSLPSAKFSTRILELFKVNINWMLTGIGPMYLNEGEGLKNEVAAPTGKPNNVIDSDQPEFIKGFHDKELAIQISQNLIEIERLDRDALQGIAHKTEGMLEGLRRTVQKEEAMAEKNRQIAMLKAQLAESRARGCDPDADMNET